MNDKRATGAICEEIEGRTLPRWQELPDLELYMDQVLSLVTRYLGGCPGLGKKGLTASMVNNYVKLGAMPPPVKKRYGRLHLAYLIAICILKTSLPIDSARHLAAEAIGEGGERYDRFCVWFEEASFGAAVNARERFRAEGDELAAVCGAALRAEAEQALAERLLRGEDNNGDVC